MRINYLYDVYVSQLKDMYSAEKQLTEALPKMAAEVSTPELERAFQAHLQETQAHMEKVRQILDELDENPGNTKCEGMAGLVKEGEHVLKLEGYRKAKDALIILAAQKAEHYEIATYGGLHAYANELGYDEHAATLQAILDEEYEADQKLDDIALGGLLTEGLNQEAERGS